jgi:predicted nucleic acid-binding protein
VLDELDKAPEFVAAFVEGLDTEIVVIDIDSDIEALRDAYMEAGIVGKSSFDDAEHIAVASVEKVDLVVSWNFKHIVHFDKIKGYNAINMLKGYQSVDIRSPSEVIVHEDQDV